MKNLIVKTLSALLVMLTAVSILSPAASAKSKRIVELRSFENSKIIRCGDELSVVQYDENGKVLSKAANNDANQGVVRASLPSSFDLRSKNAITSVKDQAGTGTCWAFSTIAAIESNAIMKGLRSSNGLDLSEDHLVWFTFHPDKAIGDKVVVSESNDDSDSPYNCGGWWNTAVYSLVNWVGVETEQNAPFDPDDNDRNGHYNDSERYGSTLHVQGVKNLASDNQA
ncbi:MAG: hypothetical protein IJQ26_06020, partial [Lachnospiraceae bacterium]|nr:hypothetical protein [Lachnospiraceae bacterium]